MELSRKKEPTNIQAQELHTARLRDLDEVNKNDGIELLINSMYSKILTKDVDKLEGIELSIFKGDIATEFRNSSLDQLKKAFTWAVVNITNREDKVYRVDLQTIGRVLAMHKEYLILKKVHKLEKPLPPEKQIPVDYTDQINNGIVRAFNDYKKTGIIHELFEKMVYDILFKRKIVGQNKKENTIVWKQAVQIEKKKLEAKVRQVKCGETRGTAKVAIQHLKRCREEKEQGLQPVKSDHVTEFFRQVEKTAKLETVRNYFDQTIKNKTEIIELI